MKPKDLVESHPLYDDYWMLRFLQDTPGLGYGIYRLCEIAETCIRVHLDDSDGFVELNESVEAPSTHALDAAMRNMTQLQLVTHYDELDEDGNPVEDMVNYWNYDNIVASLRQRCQDVLSKMEVAQ